MIPPHCDYVPRTKKGCIVFVCYLLDVLLVFASDSSDSIAHSTSSSCPGSCYCDENGEFVSCVGDGMWKLPTDIPSSTLRLELRNYFTKEVSSEDFSTLTSLQELKLQQSHIEAIQNGSFAENVNLQKLDLSQNILTGLSSSAFGSLSKLRHLDLSSNLIETVEQAFVGLDSLEQLNLRDNMLQQLTTNTFLGLHKVQYLNLDTNNISSIEVGTFQYLTNLAHLIISNNPLTALSRLDFFGSRLEFIDISHVGLNIIPQSLTKFVRDLRLAKNNVTHISAGDFDSYPYLGLLVLDDNCVTEIENDALGRQEYLRRLWLNGNCLTSVPPNLPPSLLALYMEENKLTELERYSFKGLVLLEQLFLQRNEIKQIDLCAFCDLSSLKSLDLQANQIENLTFGMFNNLTQLQTLDLSQNNLKYIDSRSFEGLTYLRTLQVSRVHTTVQLSESVFDPLHTLLTFEVYDSSDLVQKILNSTRMLHGLRKVEELNLMHNHIVRLRPDFPSFFPALRLIKLSGNAWHCDDNIQWLSTWMKQSNVQFYSSYNVRCATPKSLNFKPLMMLVPTDFTTTTDVLMTQAVLTPELSTPQATTTVSSTTTFSTLEHSEAPKTEAMTAAASERLNSSQSSEGNRRLPFTHAYYYDIITSNNMKHEKVDDRSTSTSTQSDSTLKFISESTTETEQPVTTGQIEDSEEGNFTSNKSSLTSSKPSSLQTISSQRRVLSSRLRVPTETDPNLTGPIPSSMIFFGAIITLVSLVVAIVFILFSSCGHVTTVGQYQPVKHKNIRRSGSISYHPQKDEVSIVTLPDSGFESRTPPQQGMDGKLYYIMENCASSTEATNDNVPDPQLQELLPRSQKESEYVY